KEFGDKLPADKKGEIENQVSELKKAHAEKNLDAIRSTMDALNATFQAASAEMYNNTSGNASQGSESAGGADGEVTDVDFEEVKDEKK
ncbi:MAG: hypothetical protein RL092_495, partial [Bacteroidota bacterium]